MCDFQSALWYDRSGSCPFVLPAPRGSTWSGEQHSRTADSEARKEGFPCYEYLSCCTSSLHLTLPFGTSCVKLVVKGWSETGKGFGKFMGQLDTFYLSLLWHLVAFHFHPQIRYATWLINSGAGQQLAWWKWVITFHFPWLEFWLPLT